MTWVWVRRAIIAVLIYLAALIATMLLQWGPEPVRLALVVALVVGLSALVLNAVSSGVPSWTVDSLVPASQPGRDAHFATYLRVVEGHLTAATPDPVLRDRLATLADRRLIQHHGVRRGDPRAAELLGPDLSAALDGPPRQMSLTEIERHLTRIEDL